MGHEGLHIILRHPFRTKRYLDRGLGPDKLPFAKREWGISNRGQDMIINDIVLRAGLKLPKGALTSSRFGQNDIADDVYCVLNAEAIAKREEQAKQEAERQQAMEDMDMSDCNQQAGSSGDTDDTSGDDLDFDAEDNAANDECPDCGSEEMDRLLSVPAAPSVKSGKSLPMASEGCGAPRCCGGGCDL